MLLAGPRPACSVAQPCAVPLLSIFLKNADRCARAGEQSSRRRCPTLASGAARALLRWPGPVLARALCQPADAAERMLAGMASRSARRSALTLATASSRISALSALPLSEAGPRRLLSYTMSGMTACVFRRGAWPLVRTGSEARSLVEHERVHRRFVTYLQATARSPQRSSLLGHACAAAMQACNADLASSRLASMHSPRQRIIRCWRARDS
jgi:hypothetical protein